MLLDNIIILTYSNPVGDVAADKVCHVEDEKTHQSAEVRICSGIRVRSEVNEERHGL